MKKIILTRGAVALVDDEDFDFLNQYSWHLTGSQKNMYAATAQRVGGQRLMHRILMGMTDDAWVVDHKDGNGLNNQRSNLRIATTAENRRNVSLRYPGTQYIGVFKQDDDRWAFYFTHQGKSRIIRSFATDKEAAFVRNQYIEAIGDEFMPKNEIIIHSQEEYEALSGRKLVFPGRQGHNFIKPIEVVKSERFTVKFTKAEYAKIDELLNQTGEERMAFCRQAILDAVEKRLNPAKPIDIQRMPTNLNDVDGDILTLHRQGKTPQEIAKSVGWSVSLVKARIRELAV